MLFTKVMSRRKVYLYSGLTIIIFFTWMLSDSGKNNEEFSEIVKISLRDVGHQLLISNQDSTSLILPVVELEDTKYKLSFQNQLSFDPDSLVSIVQNSFYKAKLPNYYRVEVIQCTDQEVAYSYEVKNMEENNIIPCKGRYLPEHCYTIEVRFTKEMASFVSNEPLLYGLALVVIFILLFFFYKGKSAEKSEDKNEEYAKIGSFQFYPEQNKLVKQAIEINLSKKECELLAIFVANPNQIVKRDELTKRVWEDNGVFVGRSLDTYISKLRKKLKDDDSIKLTNVHGVGYKLELNY